MKTTTRWRLIMLAATCTAAAFGGCAEDPVPLPPAPVPPNASPQALRLLSPTQYRNAVTSLLGPVAGAQVDSPEISPVSGFRTIGAAHLALGDVAVTQYEDMAVRAVSIAYSQDPSAIAEAVGCTPSGNDDQECLRSFVTSFGQRAFRRPLSGEEIDRYVALGNVGIAHQGSFDGAVFAVMVGVLQSPHFLYLPELGEGEVLPDGRIALSGVELASRIAFFLLASPPDEALLEDALSGKLDTAEGIREAATALLQRTEARTALDGYFEELLRLDGLDAVVKVPSAFSQLGFNGDEVVSVGGPFVDSARGETIHFLQDIVFDRNADYREIFTADYTFTNAFNRRFYFGTIPDGSEDFTVFTPETLPAEQGRRGILGHVSLLSMLAHADRTSPTLRGKFIREVFLCGSLPPPPDDVSFELPPDDVAPTVRAKLSAHLAPGCDSCHNLMDNIGFALEQFDGLGFYRTEENGYPLDTSGDLEGKPLADAVDLGQALSEDPAMPACAVSKLYRYATGHVETEGERVTLNALVARFVADGYRLKPLMVELVASDGFRFVTVTSNEE